MIRTSAIHLLLLACGALAGASDDGLERLRDHLASDLLEERRAAIRVCAAAPDAGRAQLLATSLGDSDLGITERRLLGLALAPLADARLLELMAAQGDDLADGAAMALGHRPPAQLATLLTQAWPRRAADTAFGERLDLALAQAFAVARTQGRGGDPALLDLVLLRMASTDGGERASALRAFPCAQLGPEVVARLAADPDPRVRALLLDRAEGYRCWDDPQDRAAVWRIAVGLASDDHAEVRVQAQRVLFSRQVAGDGVIPKAELDAALRGAVERGLSDPSAEVRMAMNVAIGEARLPGLADAIEPLCEDPDETVAATALRALDSLDHPTIAERAVAALDHRGDWVRRSGLEILVARRDPRLGTLALRLVDDDDWSVRSQAQQILDQRSGLGRGMSAALAAGDRGPEVGAALGELMRLPPAQRAQALEQHLGEIPAGERGGFIRGIAYADEAAIDPFLVGLIDDADPAIAIAAIEALRQRRGHSAANPLIGFSEVVARVADSDEAVASSAFRYAVTVPSHALRAQLVERHLQRHPDGWSWAAHQLNEALPQRWTIPARYLDHPDANTRVEALRSLRTYAGFWQDEEIWPRAVLAATRLAGLPAGSPRDDAAIARLVTIAEAAERHQLPTVLAILGRCDHPQVRGVLAGYADHASPLVRWAARDALLINGDDSDEVLDHALARLLLEQRHGQVWPILTPRLLERLDGLRGIADAGALAALRREIEQRMASGPEVAPPSALELEALGAGEVRLYPAEPPEVGRWRDADVTEWNDAVVSERAGALRIVVEAGDKGKGAAKTELMLDPVPARELRCRLRNEGGESVGIALGLITASAAGFHETPIQQLPPGGATELRFDLDAATFKSSESGWEHTATLAAPDVITSVRLLIYQQREATVVLESMTLRRDAP